MPARPPLPKGTIGVLVVEDEAVVRMVTTEALESAGMAVFAALDADEGVGILEQRDDISVLITDLDMPAGKLSGSDFVQSVAARWPKVGIVVLSGADALQRKGLPSGVQFLPKPSNPRTLVGAAFAIVSRQIGSI